MIQLKNFKFVATLVLVLKKIESEDKYYNDNKHTKIFRKKFRLDY